ncbi:imidazole glycerol phosphate synthase subunit HisH [methanotrophic endosymbiont of Bathymodiolus puteoserpentis (Logatchev)]|jgi:glutamine amidotransferase|uniref:imidazole glycerol phosphate synthase subunit HisH n=1 Tax=methanotrophic endosymbiont of Bathymodiolus puteoserpentis (Logatchev) TaxID=343235 RepID=UPI00157B6D95|nr:imidazole glycerol phosphate synthase subunit HisH [methanotrophic endosymbiont of Bathymodiolus puteoserpentis (Logatchev)]
MSSVAVIDYGMGNLHSIAKALQHAAPDVDVRVVSDLKSILSADRVVFPGVGAMRDCMHALQETELNQVIAQVAQTRPLLGICLGMQALLTNSEENGGVECLNILPGQVKHFPEDLRAANGERLKIPHMGWNQVEQHAHPLWKGVPQNSRFYFVHSYYAQPDSSVIVAGTTEYPENFACALAKDNIFAVQFHPEKSQTAGLQLLNNFLHWDG